MSDKNPIIEAYEEGVIGLGEVNDEIIDLQTQLKEVNEELQSYKTSDKFKMTDQLLEAACRKQEKLLEEIESLHDEVKILTDCSTDIEAFKECDNDLLIKIICQRDKLRGIVADELTELKTRVSVICQSTWFDDIIDGLPSDTPDDLQATALHDEMIKLLNRH